VTRSVPEKTLEHWASQYITYTYRADAALWWPANGEDIRFGHLPARPGKALQLELKTTEVVPHQRGVHEVKVDLGQLWEYRHRSLGQQPFYAFPKPIWSGELSEAAATSGRVAADLGFGRRGRGWAFANWMVVLTTEQVAQIMAKELAGHPSRERGTRKRLVRFTLGSSPEWGPDSGADDPGAICWRDFWRTITQCGRPGWPQLVHLPESLATATNGYEHQDLAALLKRAGRRRKSEPLVVLEPGKDGSYRRVADDTGSALARRGDSDGDDALRLSEVEDIDEIDRLPAAELDHRLITFLDARTVR
jgi:hypothetical protein